MTIVYGSPDEGRDIISTENHSRTDFGETDQDEPQRELHASQDPSATDGSPKRDGEAVRLQPNRLRTWKYPPDSLGNYVSGRAVNACCDLIFEHYFSSMPMLHNDGC